MKPARLGKQKIDIDDEQGSEPPGAIDESVAMLGIGCVDNQSSRVDYMTRWLEKNISLLTFFALWLLGLATQAIF